MIEKFTSTSDERLVNNPEQQSNCPGDPMRLQYRKLSDEEKEAMGVLKREYEFLFVRLLGISEQDGKSRELSIAMTKLEESCMWAVKHITR